MINDGNAGGADSAEDVLLTQMQVLKQLIPKLKEKWGSLAAALSTESIDVKRLDQLFFASRDRRDLRFEEVSKELDLIARTCSGKVALGEGVERHFA